MGHKNDGKTFYSIHRPLSWIERKHDLTLGTCIAEAESREAAIKAAQDYLEECAAEEGEYGSSQEPFTLVAHVWDTGEETREEINLKWCAEKCTYDGGRFDYLSGIGAL